MASVFCLILMVSVGIGSARILWDDRYKFQRTSSKTGDSKFFLKVVPISVNKLINSMSYSSFTFRLHEQYVWLGPRGIPSVGSTDKRKRDDTLLFLQNLDASADRVIIKKIL